MSDKIKEILTAPIVYQDYKTHREIVPLSEEEIKAIWLNDLICLFEARSSFEGGKKNPMIAPLIDVIVRENALSRVRQEALFILSTVSIDKHKEPLAGFEKSLWLYALQDEDYLVRSLAKMLVEGKEFMAHFSSNLYDAMVLELYQSKICHIDELCTDLDNLKLCLGNTEPEYQVTSRKSSSHKDVRNLSIKEILGPNTAHDADWQPYDTNFAKIMLHHQDKAIKQRLITNLAYKKGYDGCIDPPCKQLVAALAGREIEVRLRAKHLALVLLKDQHFDSMYAALVNALNRLGEIKLYNKVKDTNPDTIQNLYL